MSDERRPWDVPRAAELVVERLTPKEVVQLLWYYAGLEARALAFGSQPSERQVLAQLLAVIQDCRHAERLEPFSEAEVAAFRAALDEPKQKGAT